MKGDPLMRISQRWIEAVQEEIQSWMADLMKDAFNPTSLAGFIRAMGIDTSQLYRMVGQQPGFDAYQILGLDKSVSDEEVRHRYRALLRRLHPDTAGVEGTELLLQLVMQLLPLLNLTLPSGLHRLELKVLLMVNLLF